MNKMSSGLLLSLFFLTTVNLFPVESLKIEKTKLLTEKIEKKITDTIMNNIFLPGMAVGIAFNDGTEYTQGFGLANIEYNAEVKPDSVFEIGSLSKIFTAVGILLLQQDGKLNVNDKISQYFPSHPSGDSITIRNLLQHTSGIPDLLGLEPFKSNQGKYWTPQELTKIIEAAPLEFEPGQRAKYSSSGFMLLGLIIEKVSGENFSNFLFSRITKPLGMENTILGANNLIIKGRVSGYTMTENGINNAEYANVSAAYASAGIMSTAKDMVKLKNIFKPGILLNEGSIEEMCAPTIFNNERTGIFKIGNDECTFGYGLDMFKLNQTFLYGKIGIISGFNSFFAYFKEIDTFIIVLSNMDNTIADDYNLTIAIADIIREESKK